MCFGCSKEPSHRDGSFEYPQHMFWLRDKKNNFQLPSLIWGPDKDRMTNSQLNISSGSTSFQKICNSYTMGCPPVRGDNPRDLASGLSYVQVDKHGITILYHLSNISVDLVHHEMYRAKVGKGGIKTNFNTKIQIQLQLKLFITSLLITEYSISDIKLLNGSVSIKIPSL